MVIEVKQNGKFVKIPYVTADIPVVEAPVDGKQYGRQNETWTEIVKTDLSGLEASIETKVDKETGKGLSTNDYTTAEKTKLEAVPAPADIVVDSDSRLTVATTSKNGLMSAADKVQLDSTLTSTEIENKVNAAVSSVYRVKGNVATINNLPTANVAVGDVWNISDTGANYVAVSKDPVEWDKLSETVDLTPYMLTNDANNTFVKKAGDTMMGDMVIAKSNPLFLFKDAAGSTYGGIGAHSTVEPGVFLYNSKRGNYLRYKDNGELVFEDKKVLLNDGSVDVIDKLKIESTAKTSQTLFTYAGMNITPVSSSNATGITWTTQDKTSSLCGIGAFTIGDQDNYTYMGWGTYPWDINNGLNVSKDIFTYKSHAIWHEGNDGAGSGLDADLLDGKDSSDFCLVNPRTIADNFANPVVAGYGYQENGWITTGPIISVGVGGNTEPYFMQFQSNTGNGDLYYRTIYNKNFSPWRILSFKSDNVVLTQTEYDALGSIVNNDGKIYFIKE